MKELEELGLSKNETRVYLAALQTGATTTKRLAALTALPRSTVYDVLESLKEKGLASSYKKEKKQYFQASKPEAIIEQLKEKEKLALRLIPELKQIQGSISERPKLQLFEGTGGLYTALDEIITERKELLIIGNREQSDKILKHVPEQFAIKRLEYNIPMRGVFEPSKISASLNKGKIGKITTIRFNKKIGEMNTVTFIYGNTVVTITLEPNPIGVKVTSKAIANSMRIIFEELWKGAERTAKN